MLLPEWMVVMKVLRFLMSTMIWAIFTCGPTFVVMRRFGPVSDYVWLLLFLLFGSAVEAGLLWSLATQARNLSTAILWGAALGFVVPSVWGFLMAKDLAAFDAQPLVAIGSRMSFPSAIGGALAGCIQWSRKVIAGTGPG
jgi:hypothetical protein